MDRYDRESQDRAEYEGMTLQTEGEIKPTGPDFLKERYERSQSGRSQIFRDSPLQQQADLLAEANRHDWPRRLRF